MREQTETLIMDLTIVVFLKIELKLIRSEQVHAYMSDMGLLIRNN